MSASMERKMAGTNHLPPRTSTTDTLVGKSAARSLETTSADTNAEQSEQKDIVQSGSRTSTEQPSAPFLPSLPPRPAKKRVAFASAPVSTSYGIEASCKSDEEMPRSWNPFFCRSGNLNEDFDLSNRTKTYKATRLSSIQRSFSSKKSSLLRRISSSSMAQAAEADAKTSTSSDSDSNSNNTTITTTDEPDAALLPQTPLSSLPSDRSALEGLINIHLSKLDRLRRHITAINTELRSLLSQLRDLRSSREARAIPQLVALLQMEIFQLRMMRNSKKLFVEFHRGELAAIAEKRGLLDAGAGLTPRLPLVYEWLEGDDVWEKRFW